jgi:hypothetical protein
MDERGIEPLAMKLLAGLILLAAGLGLGITLYRRAGKAVERLGVQLSLEPSSWTLRRPDNENSLTVLVTVEPLLDFHETVALSVEGRPPGVSVSFSRPSGVPPFYSNLSITVTTQATPDNYVLTVKAEGGGALATQPFQLTIT